MINLIPRDYQNTILETSKKHNTLVVLPTGVGKTLIALLLSIERLKQFPTSKVLFLAPTRPLVEQHYETFKSQLPELFADLQLFTGSVPAAKRKKIFQTAEIIFSTPQCIANDLKSYLYTLDEVSLLVMDEAHRCLKNYAYTKVVDYYKRQAVNQRIIGMTASPGSEPEKVRQICKHLNIKEIESRTRLSPDVKPYLKELKFEKIMIEFPKEFIEIRVLLKRIWDLNINKLKAKNLLWGPANKITLLKLQSNLFNRIKSKDFVAMYGVSLTAQAIKISHALELLETQTLSGLNEYLKGLIEQARENKSRAVKILVKTPEFNAALISIQNLVTKKVEHPKMAKVKEIVESEFIKNPNSKIIIFSQYRETAHSISKVLSQLDNVKPAVFIGQAKKALTGGLSQKEQKAILDKFRSDDFNVICSTSIGEEGLDIPEVSLVIFYEPIPSAIRKIQRTGRTARLVPGKLMILITKDTRDEISHYASTAREKKMHKTIDQIQKEIKTKPPTLNDFK